MELANFVSGHCVAPSPECPDRRQIRAPDEEGQFRLTFCRVVFASEVCRRRLNHSFWILPKGCCQDFFKQSCSQGSTKFSVQSLHCQTGPVPDGEILFRRRDIQPKSRQTTRTRTAAAGTAMTTTITAATATATSTAIAAATATPSTRSTSSLLATEVSTQS